MSTVRLLQRRHARYCGQAAAVFRDEGNLCQPASFLDKYQNCLGLPEHDDVAKLPLSTRGIPISFVLQSRFLNRGFTTSQDVSFW